MTAYDARRSILEAALLAAMLCAGCGESDARADDDVPAAAAAATKAEPNVISGRVTFPDGKPITTNGVKLTVSAGGVATKSAEKVSFNPAVKADGTFRQKVPEGSYQIRYGKAAVTYGEHAFTFDLEPQGDNYMENRDSEEGIVQDFFWRVTGPRQMYKDGKLDPNNHTHWNGMNLGMRYATYREDLKKGAESLPDGTKLTFTLTPVEGKKAIDGSDLKVVTFERETKGSENTDLNDFLPGEYTVTGVAKLADGTSKPIVFQGKGDYPGYVTAGKVTLEKDGILGGMWKQLFSWGINP